MMTNRKQTEDARRRQNAKADARRGERGAALIMTLLVATLVIAAGGALIMSTGTSATNAIDAAAERQAYYAAEAGLQAALGALRGNLPPDAAVTAGTKMSFRTAVTPDLSNGAGRSAAADLCGSAAADDSWCRLAGWLPYDDPADADGLVPVGDRSFRVTVFDPDDSHNVTFATEGAFTADAAFAADVTNPSVSVQSGGLSLVLTDRADASKRTTITYTNRASAAVSNAVPSANTGFGQFTVSQQNGGAAAPDDTLFATFTLQINQTKPWAGIATMRAQLYTTTAAGCPFNVVFDSNTAQAQSTRYSIQNLVARTQSLACAANVAMTATVTAPAPKRVVVRSWGFGPRWAEKRLELVVDRAVLDAEFPAAVTIRGADDCSPSNIDTGSSGAKDYTGTDRDGVDGPRPAFAVTSCDVATAEGGIKKHDTVADPEIGVLDYGAPPAGTATTVPTNPVAMPSFLETADAARAYVEELMAEAKTQNRYFSPASGSSRTVTNSDGTIASPGFTFVDGDCILDTSAGAAGLLVVTGNLEMSGNPTFDGIILVLGEGSVNRNGGGSGTISGAMIVARFARSWPASENGMDHPFLAPTFNTNGGGNSTIQSSSTAITNAINVFGGSRVKGVLEF
jgi:hypothetical protein